MREKLLHTPDGVRDIYETECKKKLKVIEHLHHVLELYSYADIETPTFEYFDIFNGDKGSAASNEMYKFFDRDNNTLVLRPDFTPSIARCVAKYYETEDLPIRLCYTGNTYNNKHSLQGKLKEVTQIGAELINDDSSAADVEILATVIDCFLASGLKEFQIEVGQVEFFKGLIEEYNIDCNTEEQIRAFINNKNFFGLEEFVKKLDIPSNVKNAFSKFESLFGGLSMLEEAKTLVNNNRSLTAIERLEKVYTAISYYGYEDYVSFDLSMLSNYNYYTGIIFRGYTYGTGDAVVKGGRYNNLLKQFGKDAPSIGFAFTIDELMLALSRQKIDIEIDNSDTIVLYDLENQNEAITLAKKYRKNGMKIELIRKSSRKTIEDYKIYARNNHFSGIMYFESNTQIMIIDMVTGDTNTIDINRLTLND